MSKKSGIAMKLTYDMWSCTVPKNTKCYAKALKKNIKDIMMSGFFDGYYREFPVVARAPFMELDTAQRTPYVKVNLDESRVKTSVLANGIRGFEDNIEVTYRGKIFVDVVWRCKY